MLSPVPGRSTPELPTLPVLGGGSGSCELLDRQGFRSERLRPAGAVTSQRRTLSKVVLWARPASPLDKDSADRLTLSWSCTLDVHLINGTYEWFWHYYALPSARDRYDREVAGARGVLASVLGMVGAGATHLAVATDHVIECFRNRLWPGYKTGDGIEPDLLAQFNLLEETLSAAGFVVWPMTEFEADDALAAAAGTAVQDAPVECVIICTPDKDLAQCLRGARVVQLNRRTRVTLDQAGVIGKFGVSPGFIPDYLALIGDSADGYPGLPGWGARSSAAVLAKFAHLESIPTDWRNWGVNTANASALARTLSSERERALLFRTLATLRTGFALFADVDELQWRGPGPGFDEFRARLAAATTGATKNVGRRSSPHSDSRSGPGVSQ